MFCDQATREAHGSPPGGGGGLIDPSGLPNELVTSSQTGE